MFNAEGTIEVNAKYANLFAFCIELFNNGTYGFGAAAHDDNDIFCILSTVVVEQVILTTGKFGDFAHVFFYDFRQFVVIGVNCFTSLEIDVRVLSSTADNRVVRVQATLTEGSNCVFVQQFCQFIIFQNFNFLNFVGGTEAVKEVQERNATFNRSQVSNASQVHNFLYTAFCQKGKAGLTSCHNVLVVTKDGQGAGCQCASRYMEYCGQKFASHFIHIGNH